MFIKNITWVRKRWMLSFILLAFIGLMVIPQQTLPQGPVLAPLHAKHAKIVHCKVNQTLKVFVFYRRDCKEVPVGGALVELKRGCKVVAKDKTNKYGIVQIDFKVPCPPPHCYLIVKATHPGFSKYLGAAAIKKNIKPSR